LHAQDLRRSAVVEAVRVDEQHRRPLLRRQRSERLRQRAPADDGLGEVTRVRRFATRVERRDRMCLQAPQLVEASVVDDAVEPRGGRGATAEARQRPERLHISLLERVVHAIAVAQQPKRKPAQRMVVHVDQRGERRRVASLGARVRRLVCAGGRQRGHIVLDGRRRSIVPFL
jgi:hypothetical protein